MCRRDFDEWHCNAHANNMALLSPEEGQRLQCFLGYLDLDMAFDETSFVDLWAPEGNRGTAVGASAEEFTKLLQRENAEFLEVLCGGDSTNGVPQVAMQAVEAQGPLMHAARCCLYDTFALGYLDGHGDEIGAKAAPFNAQLHKAAFAIVKLAIVVMADFVA